MTCDIGVVIELGQGIAEKRRERSAALQPLAPPDGELANDCSRSAVESSESALVGETVHDAVGNESRLVVGALSDADGIELLGVDVVSSVTDWERGRASWHWAAGYGE